MTVNPRAEVDRLLDEIALLRDVMEANERIQRAYSEQEKSHREAEADYFWSCAIQAGISEDDADHPCRAIDQREARLREIAPDRVLREMGVAMLPGMPA